MSASGPDRSRRPAEDKDPEVAADEMVALLLRRRPWVWEIYDRGGRKVAECAKTYPSRSSAASFGRRHLRSLEGRVQMGTVVVRDVRDGLDAAA